MEELSDILIVQKLVTKNIEIAKSIPEYNGQSHIDQFNIQLTQFVQLTKTDVGALKDMLLLLLKGQSLTFIKQIEHTIGNNANLPINTVDDLLKAFKERFIETSSINKLKHGVVNFDFSQNIREYLDNIRISVEAKYGSGSGQLYEKVILNTFLQGLPPKLYRVVISKNIQTLDLAVQEVERLIEVDKMVANHSNAKINSLGDSNANPIFKGDQASPNFFSRDNSPVAQRNKTPEPARQKTVRFQPINPTIIRCYNCNRVGHIARECHYVTNPIPRNAVGNTQNYGNHLFRRTNFSTGRAIGYSQGGLRQSVPYNAYQPNLYSPFPNRQINYRFENPNTRQGQYNARMQYRNHENLPMRNENFTSQRHWQSTPANGTDTRHPRYHNNTWQRQADVNHLNMPTEPNTSEYLLQAPTNEINSQGNASGPSET